MENTETIYTAPAFEIIALGASDIILTSGPDPEPDEGLLLPEDTF